MTLEDFIEFYFSRLRKGAPRGLGVPDELAPLGGYDRIRRLVEEAPIFHLEAGDGDTALIREIGEDVLRDLQTTLPCPFDNFAIIEKCPGSDAWRFQWILKLANYGSWPESAAPPGGDPFLLWSFTNDREDGPVDFWGAIRFWYVARERGSVYVSKDSVERIAKGLGRTQEATMEALHAVAFGITFEIGAISHPTNYIVERTPLLSPREERRVARGEPRPVRKRPVLILIDHDELVELNPRTRTPAGTHRPPIPHARRGHWMRLSERCRHLREQGKDKVWIRETYVGEREFADGKNRYRVFLSATELGNEVTSSSSAGVRPILRVGDGASGSL